MILHDVRLVVRDFEPMQERARHMAELARRAAVSYSPQEVGETVDFIEWLLQLNFVFLGYREYRLDDGPEGRTIQTVPASGLGILSDVSMSSFSDATPLTPSTPTSGAGSRRASCSSSQDAARTARCTAARGWTTWACGSSRPRARSSARRG